MQGFNIYKSIYRMHYINKRKDKHFIFKVFAFRDGPEKVTGGMFNALW